MALQVYREKTKKNKLFAFDFQTLYEHAVCTEYFCAYGDNIESKNNNTVITNCGKSVLNGWNTAYGKVEIIPKSNRKYVWAFFITQLHQKYSSVCIGIEELDGANSNNKNTYFHGQTSLTNYGYKSNGKKYSNTFGYGAGFSDPYNSSGDIVLMCLDGYKLLFCKLSPEFCKLRKIKKIEDYFECGAWIVAEEKIAKRIKYRMAVSLYGKTKLFGSEKLDQSSIELLGYQMVQTETKEDEEDDSDDSDGDCIGIYADNELQKAIISLEGRLAAFEMKYGRDKILKQYNENAASIHVVEDIQRLQQRMQSCSNHLNGMETYIASLVHVDVSNYESWGIPQMMHWISSLEGGEYQKYLKVLKRAFESEHIDSGAMLGYLTAADLSVPPFNIRNFMDRKKLSQHFQRLGEQPGSRGGVKYI